MTVQTYKFYDQTGRRIGAIGEEVDGKLRVFLLFCSKKDKFSKKKVKEAFKNWKDLVKDDTHPVVFDIPMEQCAAKTLIGYMESIYFRKERTISAYIVQQLLVGRNEVHVVRGENYVMKFPKMDW